jgi:DNA-binding PucR family transcriptional regulator
LASKLARGPVTVAISRIVAGIGGFREAYRQAMRARDVALASPGSLAGSLLRYDDISLVSLLYDDPEAARGFAADELGELVRDNSPNKVLRRTVLTFVRTGTVNGTAEALGVHRNTVAQRLRRAESVVGHPLSVRRIEVHAALMLCEQLGQNVLSD